MLSPYHTLVVSAEADVDHLAALERAHDVVEFSSLQVCFIVSLHVLHITVGFLRLSMSAFLNMFNLAIEY